MTISAKSVRIFTAVEALRAGQHDVRYALLPIFEPDFAKFNGEIYDPTKLSFEINAQYRLNITPDIVEHFTPLFLEKGWIVEITPPPNASYRVKYENTTISTSLDNFEKNAQAIGAEFKKFVSEISPLFQVDTREENLIDILVDWLVSLDIYTEEDLKRVRFVEKSGEKLVYVVDRPGEKALSEEQYLAARFASHLLKTQSDLVPMLVELGSVGLITEVVRDFQRPSAAAKNTDLIVYLDAPVAFDYIGMSGEAARDNIATILSRITSLGGSLRIFRFSVDEMQRSARAILQRPLAERTGPTARALQQREVMEAFVRQVAASPDNILSQLGVRIAEQTIDQFPGEHRYFSKDLVQEFYSKVGWIESPDARWHDAVVAAFIMRKRAGVRTNDLFAAKHVLITRNPMFGPVARRFAREKNLIGPDHIGPVVHHRDCATSVWLRAGLGVSDQEVPRKYILSACQRVLSLNRSVVQKVREASREMNDYQKQQLELLLVESRATQVLMDKTLGAANVIDSSNVEFLVSEMERAIGEKAHAEADAKVAAAKAESRRTSAKHRKQLSEYENAIEDERRARQQAAEQYQAVIMAIISSTNIEIRRRRIFAYAGFVILFLVSQILSYATNLFEGGSILYISILGIALASVVQFIKPIRDRIVDPFWMRSDWRLLERRATAMNINDIRRYVNYVGSRFDYKTIIDSEEIQGEGELSDKLL